MSRNEKTRSRLEIDAVAQAAAGDTAAVVPPKRQSNNIAALAGFVLRLFRFKERNSLPSGQPRPGHRLAPRVAKHRRAGHWPASESHVAGANQVRTTIEPRPNEGTPPGAARNGGVTVRKGGYSHGTR